MKDAMPLEKAEVATELPPVKDYYKWACEQAALIRAGRFDQIDALNVADEIEDVGKNELGALASNIEIIIVHILKWNYQPSRRSRSWSNSSETRDPSFARKPRLPDQTRRGHQRGARVRSFRRGSPNQTRPLPRSRDMPFLLVRHHGQTFRN